MRSRVKSTTQTPPGHARENRLPALSANRLLPMPPGPVSVSSLVRAYDLLMRASSRPRPMKLVSSTGRLPLLRAFMAGK